MDTLTFEQFSGFDGVDDWRADGDGAAVRFHTGDFATGARLFAVIAELAEAANHHPDVEITYPSVRVHLISHEAGGLTRKDAQLAAAISHAARELGVAAESEG
ncbi:4a-hydroxytetrahydrobiopterin dehydratase [Microbacterium luticocti]|uniref:4a-hydroxytetrahydrobiopterin dehydratase n=1 Tax=Microbacterium luticocti TaxID=451764 RepID=UPI0003FF17F7|nr:4a-hydroxytetrahydrobiopterin dehydratase [Microbacterium luticocti]